MGKRVQPGQASRKVSASQDGNLQARLANVLKPRKENGVDTADLFEKQDLANRALERWQGGLDSCKGGRSPGSRLSVVCFNLLEGSKNE